MDSVTALVQIFSLTLMRLSPLFLAISFSPLSRFPAMVRLIVLLVTGIALTMLQKHQWQPMDMALWIPALGYELMFGMLMLFGFQLAMGGIQIMGRVLDMQIGFAAAGIVDPVSQNNDPITGHIFSLFFLVAFFYYRCTPSAAVDVKCTFPVDAGGRVAGSNKPFCTHDVLFGTNHSGVFDFRADYYRFVVSGYLQRCDRQNHAADECLLCDDAVKDCSGHFSFKRKCSENKTSGRKKFSGNDSMVRPGVDEVMADDSNKSEKPTPHKLQEAKKKGQVAKSNEITGFLMLIGFVTVFYLTLEDVSHVVGDLFQYWIISAGQVELSINNIGSISFSLLAGLTEILSPFVLVLVLVALLANIAQTGLVISSHPITPDWKRLNPVAGLKKLFSKKALFELFKSLLKVLVIGLVWMFWGGDWLEWLFESYQHSAQGVILQWQDMFFSLLMMLMAIMFPLAVLDFAFARWDFTQQQMMSQQDIKDEHKKREGDPQVRSKQKEQQKELLQKASSLKSVKDADVIITNPEHIAVALKYDPASMVAPKILSMGADSFSGKIRAIARKHGVPVMPNKPLARRLFKECSIGQYVPESCYQDLALVFRWLLGLEKWSQN